jgi:hypothetical protein
MELKLFEISENEARQQGNQFYRLWALYQEMKADGRLAQLVEEIKREVVG